MVCVTPALLFDQVISTNPIIQISGASTSGKWKFLMLYTHVDGTFHRIIGRYEDTYAKLKASGTLVYASHSRRKTVFT